MPLGGVQVGSYDGYEQAQAAVDYLSDEKFPVENVTIIGTDLKQVERVTGRLTQGRAIAAGASPRGCRRSTAAQFADPAAGPARLQFFRTREGSKSPVAQYAVTGCAGPRRRPPRA